MKRGNINRLNSTKQVQTTVNNDPGATSAITGFAAVKSELDNKITIVESSIEISESPSSGVTMDTEDLREQTFLATFICANGLVSFASDAPVNNTLRTEAKITRSGMSKLSKEEFALKCETVVNLAVAHAAGILPKGVSATDISDAQSLVSLYKTANNFPQAKIQDKKAAGELAIITLDEIMLNLFPNKMDPMINTLIKSNNEFYKLYYNARKILNEGQGTTRITYTLMQAANLVNAATASIENKMVLARPRPVPYPIQISTPEGNIIHDKLGTGLFDITIEKAGYVIKVLRDNRVKLGGNLPLGIVQLEFAEIIIPIGPNETLVVFFPDSPQWAIGNTINAKNITSGTAISKLNLFNADNENSPYTGSGDTELENVQEFTALIESAGFKPYLKMFNNSANPGVIRIRIS